MHVRKEEAEEEEENAKAKADHKVLWTEVARMGMEGVSQSAIRPDPTKVIPRTSGL